MSEQQPVPKPGSDEALDQGCTCPVIDNRRGRGILGQFWIAEDCPIHAERQSDHEQATEAEAE